MSFRVTKTGFPAALFDHGKLEYDQVKRKDREASIQSGSLDEEERETRVDGLDDRGHLSIHVAL